MSVHGGVEVEVEVDADADADAEAGADGTGAGVRAGARGGAGEMGVRGATIVDPIQSSCTCSMIACCCGCTCGRDWPSKKSISTPMAGVRNARSR